MNEVCLNRLGNESSELDCFFQLAAHDFKFVHHL